MHHALLCYGDSNTYGYDPRSYLGGRYPESVRWTGLLNALGIKVITEGENGRSIPRLDREIESAIGVVCHSKAERIVVHAGKQRLISMPRTFRKICGARMEGFLAALLTKAQADLKVLLVASLPMAGGLGRVIREHWKHPANWPDAMIGSTFNFLVSLLYAQAFQALYYSADQIHHGALPQPV